MKHAILQLQDAASALLKLGEALILSFSLSEAASEFVLVCEFPQKAAGSSRAFAHCRFSGVREFVRIPGDLKRLAPFNSSYSSRTRSGGPQVIESIELMGDTSGVERGIELWFGYNFGGVSFKHDSVVVHTRDTKAVKRDSDTVYFDLVSGEELDFYDIFRDMKPQT